MTQKKLKKKKKNYFNSDTEAAIVRYNLSEDPEEKNNIYEKHIHYPFFKLTQNLIHTYKTYYTEVDNLEDLQHETIIFLISKLHRFDPENGAKAYSFFGTVAKRYLIATNEKNYKKRLIHTSVDTYNDQSISGEGKGFNAPGSEYFIVPSFEDYKPISTLREELSNFISDFLEVYSPKLEEMFPKNNEAQIADAVLELFRKRDELTLFNKKALYIYIKEIVNVKTPKITKVVKILSELFQKHYLFYLENGYTDFKV